MTIEIDIRSYDRYIDLCKTIGENPEEFASRAVIEVARSRLFKEHHDGKYDPESDPNSYTYALRQKLNS